MSATLSSIRRVNRSLINSTQREWAATGRRAWKCTNTDCTRWWAFWGWFFLRHALFLCLWCSMKLEYMSVSFLESLGRTCRSRFWFLFGFSQCPFSRNPSLGRRKFSTKTSWDRQFLQTFVPLSIHFSVYPSYWKRSIKVGMLLMIWQLLNGNWYNSMSPSETQ